MRVFHILLITSCLFLASCQPDRGGELPPPNILWISCEDISPALGCYGDAYASTPVIDRLAEEGVVYTRAYAPAPICSPARSSLISGVYATSLGTQHLRSDIPMPEDFRILPQYLSQAGYFCSNKAKTDYNFSFEGRWDDQGNEAHWRNRKEGQAFFAVFNHGITHEGPTNRMDEADLEGLEERHDPDLAVLPPYYPDTPAMRELWARQYDLISVLDMQVGELLDQLKEDGLYENTIIFFFGDHGFGLPRYKRWLYHTGLHVPLVVRVPEAYLHLFPAKKQAREDRLVNFVDFAPTVLSLAGVEIPHHMPGLPFLGPDAEREHEYIFGTRSRADDIYEVGRCILDKRYIYIRNFMPHQPYVTETIIFGEKKAGYRELLRLRAEGALNPEAEAFWQPKAWEELYDLQEDPHELVNLAGAPEQRERVEGLRKELYRWMVEQKDVGLLNETDMMIRSAGNSPYAFANSDRYPVQRILAAADLCGKPGVGTDEILPLLEDSDAGVRYWGVLSLRAMGLRDEGCVKCLEKLLADPSPTVAIAAAELLCDWGDPGKGLPVLEQYLREAPHETVVLQAAIAARNLGSGARELIPVIEEVFPAYRGEVWNRYRNWVYPMFIGFALDQVYVNCGLDLPQ